MKLIFPDLGLGCTLCVNKINMQVFKNINILALFLSLWLAVKDV
jgi:hypothetical protein